jgi:tRNA threonylcarbamoyladenosine biosynthesis protein TsaB
MNILAVDTTGEPGSVALARDNRVIETAALPLGWATTSLHVEIVHLLERHDLKIADIGGYAVTTGPGSFTGVRVGLTAVKGFAEVHRVRIIPVSTLQVTAVAAQATGRVSGNTAFAPLLDARRAQVFAAVYRDQNGCLTPLLEDSVLPLETFLQRVNATVSSGAIHELAFCGKDLAPFLAEIQHSALAAAPIIEIPPLLAAPLAEIAARSFERGEGVEAASADANYVRASDAELFWKG